MKFTTAKELAEFILSLPEADQQLPLNRSNREWDYLPITEAEIEDVHDWVFIKGNGVTPSRNERVVHRMINLH